MDIGLTFGEREIVCKIKKVHNIYCRGFYYCHGYWISKMYEQREHEWCIIGTIIIEMCVELNVPKIISALEQ